MKQSRIRRKIANSKRRDNRAGSESNHIKNGYRRWLAAKGPILLFVSKFGLLVLLFYTFLATDLCDRALYSYLQANAWMSNIVLNWTGQHTEVLEVTVRSPLFAMALRRGCDAVEPTFLLCSAMLAFNSPLSQKLLGIFIGSVVFQLLNILRIISLFWIGIHYPNLFEQIHTEIWPTLFIVIGALIFVAWKDWRPHGSQDTAAATT